MHQPHRHTSTRVRPGVTIFGALLALALATGAWQAAPARAGVDRDHAAADLKEVNVNDGFASLVRAVRPAVVNISVTGSTRIGGGPDNFHHQMPEGFEEFFHRFFGGPPQGPGGESRVRKTSAVGSGFIVDPDGLVVTNYHVIENADEIEVVLDNGTRLPATLRGTDSKTDLALLEVAADHPLPYVVFGNSGEAEVGDWVVAIGNPFGLGGSTTSGIISARGRDLNSGPLDDFIQIDAPINRGNSGGPLFNTRGEVIGVNSAIFSPNGGSVGIGFAIPASIAGDVVAQLKDSGSVARGFLGVHIQTVNEDIAASLGLDEPHGALVSRVMPGSPAERAGIAVGDIITGYNGERIDTLRDLPRLVALTRTGTRVDLEVWRNDETVALSAAIDTDDPEAVAAASKRENTLGLELARIDEELARQFELDAEAVGVVIVDVAPESAAARRGLRAGDVIKRVGSTDVRDPDEVEQAIEESLAKNRESILLLVERDDQARFIAVPTAA